MKYLITILLAAMVTTLAYGQTEKEIVIEESNLEYLGTSKPLRDLIKMPLTDKEKLQRAKGVKPELIPNFKNRVMPEPKPGAKPLGEDPVRQKVNRRMVPEMIEPVVNVEGIDVLSAGAGVPDPNGSIGKDHYVQTVNATLIQVFDKQGNALTDPFSANSLWSEFGFQSAGDPIILYDQLAERWFLTEFASPFVGNVLLLAVSETSDPLGSWNSWFLNTPNFPDYPKYAIWPEAYILTTNEFNFNDPGLSFYALDRQAMLDGEEDISLLRFTAPEVNNVPGFYVLSPVNWSGSTLPAEDTKPMLMRIQDDAWGQSPEDRIEYFTMDSLDFDIPSNSIISGPMPLITQPFDSDPCSSPGFGFACVPEPDGSGIDAIPLVIMHQAHYRNFGSHESIVLNFVVDATGDNVAGIRWMELRKTTGTSWSIHQEGTYAPDDGLNRFVASIAIDGQGNIGLAYAVSSAGYFASLRFTGRRASDPLGEMTVQEFEFAGGGGSIFTDRFGDYASMQVDPVNDKTFWFTGEYIRAANEWSTKIMAFEIRKDTFDLSPVEVLSPVDASNLTSNENIEVEVTNLGLVNREEFDLTCIVEGTALVTDQISTVLEPDSTYIHTFSLPADLSLIKPYDVAIIVSSGMEDNRLNDTLRTTIRHLPVLDAGLEPILPGNSPACGDTVQAVFSLVNQGTDTLYSALITPTFNGTEFPPIMWTGDLAFEESEIIPLTFQDPANGVNQFQFLVSQPNGGIDQVPSNDTIRFSRDVIRGGATVTLELQFDRFPEETVWEIIDGQGAIIGGGGPYPGRDNELLVEEFCLNPDSCYTFIIMDLFGDGLEAQGPDGSYRLIDAMGRELASIQEVNFGFEESQDFCTTFQCMLSADIQASPESTPGGGDGVIIVFAQNGNGPFQFSIDGGMNFQSGNFFPNLQSGSYDVVVRDKNDCEYTANVQVGFCDLQVSAIVTNESAAGATDGVIAIESNIDADSLEYSLDGGINWQADSVFTDLQAGSYNVTIRDNQGCQITLGGIMVDISTSTDNPEVMYGIRVMPNPTDGVFSVEVPGLEGSKSIEIQVYDMSGRLVRRALISRYDGVFKGSISLQEMPSGAYFIRVVDPRVQGLIKVIKR